MEKHTDRTESIWKTVFGAPLPKQYRRKFSYTHVVDKSVTVASMPRVLKRAHEIDRSRYTSKHLRQLRRDRGVGRPPKKEQF